MMREKILELIEENLIGAIDNACRARMQFGRMTPEQLDSEYGESGRKCKDILAEHEDSVKEAEEMKAWFLANTVSTEPSKAANNQPA